MSRFQIIEHAVRGQHIRERLGAVEPGRGNDLRLSLKQYIPKSNPHPAEGHIAIIGAHANAFPKELYEPLWDHLEDELRKRDQRIRGIWIADVTHEGQSGVLNEGIIGNDPSCWDHARDLLCIINEFRDQMSPPLIGVGHSMGASSIVQLSLLHPSLFHSLVLIDPVIERNHSTEKYARASLWRQDQWPSRAAAAEKFRQSAWCKAWDPRVQRLWIEYGLRELPTETYHEAGRVGVTLTTPRAQEQFSYVRPTYEGGKVGLRAGDWSREMHPSEHSTVDAFYCPDSTQLFHRLPEMKPSVLYIFGATSDISVPESREEKLKVTGTGIGGGGGVAQGQVKQVVLSTGHLIPMEQPGRCAAAIAGFVAGEADDWAHSTKRFREVWNAMPRGARIAIDEQWRTRMGRPPPKL